MSLIPLSKLSSKGIVYSTTHIDRLIKAGKFPRPVYLSARRRAFIEAELDDWIKTLADKRDDPEA